MPETAYKDYVDSCSKSHVGEEWPECARYALPSECDKGHEYAKLILCGKEWCKTCGEDKSWIHNRRVARWLWRAQKMNGMGLFVIEWPNDSRYKLMDKAALSAMGKRIKGAFKALGYERGLRRWHYYGDAGIKYNPHNNVITDGEYLPPPRLAEVKAYLRHVLDEPNLIVNYSFRKSPAEMMHTLRYVTRSTFKDESWSYNIAHAIYGFQNTQYWGGRAVWDGPDEWELDKVPGEPENLAVIGQLEEGICPQCGGMLKWSKPVPLALIHVVGGEHIGAGYFAIPPPGDPPDRLTSDDMQGIENWLAGVKQVARNIAEDKKAARYFRPGVQKSLFKGVFYG